VVLSDWDIATLDRECARLGESARAVRLDVTDRPAWQDARQIAESTFGPVEILVNNAGVAPDWNELADMPAEHFDRLIAIMLTGVFNGIHTFAAGMRDRGEGHVVNTASLVALTGGARQGAYVAAKAGVVGLSESLLAEMQPFGVGISVLCPGRVRTNLLTGNRPPRMSADEGLEPDALSAQVIDAIRTNDFYVVTHPEYKSLVEQRWLRLLDAFDRAAD
jgi:NAD(P)-dependent dehydrogenase (short-subunit alcohol dehydrogenase family)